jgi:hypothetical protein
VTLRAPGFSSGGLFDCAASFVKDGYSFTLHVGERILQSPNDSKSPPGPWRLDAVKCTSGDPSIPGSAFTAAAVFHHIEDGREAVKTMEAASESTLPPPDGPPGDDSIFRRRDALGRPERNKPPRLALVRSDPATNTVEFVIPEEEVEWLEAWAGDEAKGVAAVPVKDENGNPDGFQIKSVAKGSRLEAAGFKAEDRVVSVNNEKVASTEQAIAVGKRQYDEGRSTFSVKAIRNGKEMNFTFHAPKKKPKKR